MSLSFARILRVTSTVSTVLLGICVLCCRPAVAERNQPLPDLDAIDGIWISKKELAALPTEGPAWTYLVRLARQDVTEPDLSDQNDNVNVRILAKALVHARTGNTEYREQVIDACMAAIGTERGGRTLSLGRELIAYVIAADLVGLPPREDGRFRVWLKETLTEKLQGRTLRSTQEDRPNNWGSHAGASRGAVALYLRDAQELHRTAQVFKGYLGDRSSYAGFKYGSLDWQADPQRPVGINPGAQPRTVTILTACCLTICAVVVSTSPGPHPMKIMSLRHSRALCHWQCARPGRL